MFEIFYHAVSFELITFDLLKVIGGKNFSVTCLNLPLDELLQLFRNERERSILFPDSFFRIIFIC